MLCREDASPTAQSVVALVPDAVAARGRSPAGGADGVRVPVAPADQKPSEVIEQRTIAVVICIIMLVAFVAMMVVPMQTAEELETGTFGALRLAATSGRSSPRRRSPACSTRRRGRADGRAHGPRDPRPAAVLGAALALTVSLVGFGLLLGLLVRNANTINTYGGFLLFPFIGLAAAVFFVDAGSFADDPRLLPFSQGTRLLFDGVSRSSRSSRARSRGWCSAGWSARRATRCWRGSREPARGVASGPAA